MVLHLEWILKHKFLIVSIILSSLLVVRSADLPKRQQKPSNQLNYEIGNTPINRGTRGANKFQIINEWKYLDFEYPTFAQRQKSINSGQFNPRNNLPLGIDFDGNRIFLSTPRWKDGVPVSFGYIDYPAKELSPPIKPYPDWSAHGDPYNPDCSKLMSVYRTTIDECGRLWLIDSGIVNATVSINQICPPKIVAYDLSNDQLLVSYELPPEQVKQDSLHSNIVVDIHDGKCENAHVYVTDVWRYGIVVYSLEKNRSWRTTNLHFLPTPEASDFNVYGLNFQWFDGAFGMSLSWDSKGQRVLYFHPMASQKEFLVATAVLRDESAWTTGTPNLSKYFIEIGDRGPFSHSSTSGIDRSGVMFFTQVHRDNVACWDTEKPYTRANIEMLANANSTISGITFPNDVKIDQQANQGVWLMSNKLPIFLYSQLNFDEVNFRILRADAQKAVIGTMCDPNQSYDPNVQYGTVHEGQCV